MTNRLYRSSSNKMIGGVCGGMGEYFDVDPTLLRLITVVGVLATGGILILVYLVGWIVIPLDSQLIDSGRMEPHEPTRRPSDSKWRTYLPGIILVFIGAILLIREYVVWFSFFDLWPLLLVMIGLILIFRDGRGASNIDSQSPGDRYNRHDGARERGENQ